MMATHMAEQELRTYALRSFDGISGSLNASAAMNCHDQVAVHVLECSECRDRLRLIVSEYALLRRLLRTAAAPIASQAETCDNDDVAKLMPARELRVLASRSWRRRMASVAAIVAVCAAPRLLHAPDPMLPAEMGGVPLLAGSTGSEESGYPRFAALAADSANPPTAAAVEPAVVVLRAEVFGSLAYALRVAGLSDAPGQQVIPAALVRERVLPNLDPVDQWRLHQMLLSRCGSYPAEQIDGLCGAVTRRALRNCLQPTGDLAKIIEKGVLAPDAARRLFASVGELQFVVAGPAAEAGAAGGDEALLEV